LKIDDLFFIPTHPQIQLTTEEQ